MDVMREATVGEPMSKLHCWQKTRQETNGAVKENKTPFVRFQRCFFEKISYSV